MNVADRRRDEVIQLRAVLATQTKGLKNIAKINYGSSSDINLDVINEDGELVMAFEAQKRINRLDKTVSVTLIVLIVFNTKFNFLLQATGG